MDGLISALRSHKQVDEDGVMCLVSRQAVVEAADSLYLLQQVLMALENEQPFVFDPATGFIHADDGGSPLHGIRYFPIDRVNTGEQSDG